MSTSTSVADESHETMDRLFPEPPREEILRPTYVIFDAEDYSFPDPHLLKKNIETAIKKEGYRGLIQVKGYFGDKQTISQTLLGEYFDAGIYSEIYEGDDKVARWNMMLVELLLWWIAHYPKGTNVLIITRNENILEEHPKISEIIHGLEERGFYFAIEHLDSFFSPEANESRTCT